MRSSASTVDGWRRTSAPCARTRALLHAQLRHRRSNIGCTAQRAAQSRAHGNVAAHGRCLEPYSGDNPKVVLSCGHVYHLPCVLQWRERADRCPVCARPIAFVGGNVYDDGPDAGADDAAAS